jgi:hypothetical protein
LSVVGEAQVPASLLRRTANAKIDIHRRIPPPPKFIQRPNLLQMQRLVVICIRH